MLAEHSSQGNPFKIILLWSRSGSVNCFFRRVQTHLTLFLGNGLILDFNPVPPRPVRHPPRSWPAPPPASLRSTRASQHEANVTLSLKLWINDARRCPAVLRSRARSLLLRTTSSQQGTFEGKKQHQATPLFRRLWEQGNEAAREKETQSRSTENVYEGKQACADSPRILLKVGGKKYLWLWLCNNMTNQRSIDHRSNFF